MCVRVSVFDLETSKRGYLGPIWNEAPHKNVNLLKLSCSGTVLIFVPKCNIDTFMCSFFIKKRTTF